MSGSGFGEIFRITTFGESHGPLMGVVVEGMPPGIGVTEEEIWAELKRRAPGQSSVTTARTETDRPRIVSGVFEGRSTGSPIAILIDNEDAQSASYDPDVLRPGHADYTWWKKYGHRDHRGGGRASARETAARVAAGAVAKILLRTRGIEVWAHCIEIAGVRAERVDRGAIETNPVRCADPDVAPRMVAAIQEAAAQGDSVGGLVEVIAENVPVGLGDPVFNRLDALLAMALMSIPAVKGIEVGSGFRAAVLRGSENNDVMNEAGFVTNNAGGILGGISTGQPVVARIAVKPASSIRKEQTTLDRAGAVRQLSVKGRHDPCVCPRVVPVAESMVALVLADRLLVQATVR